MTTEYNFRLIVKDKKNGYRKVAGHDCHETKSLAGKMFYHDDNVQSVCVVDVTSFCYLYLVKGQPEKTIDISSDFSLF